MAKQEITLKGLDGHEDHLVYDAADGQMSGLSPLIANRHGWQVIDVYLGNPMRHDEKYLLINQGFARKQRLVPFFNRQNNDDLILSELQTVSEHIFNF